MITLNAFLLLHFSHKKWRFEKSLKNNRKRNNSDEQVVYFEKNPFSGTDEELTDAFIQALDDKETELDGITFALNTMLQYASDETVIALFSKESRLLKRLEASPRETIRQFAHRACLDSMQTSSNQNPEVTKTNLSVAPQTPSEKKLDGTLTFDHFLLLFDKKKRWTFTKVEDNPRIIQCAEKGVSTVYFTGEPFSYTSNQDLLNSILNAFKENKCSKKAIFTGLEVLWRYSKKDTIDFLSDNSELKTHLEKEKEQESSENESGKKEEGGNTLSETTQKPVEKMQEETLTLQHFFLIFSKKERWIFTKVEKDPCIIKCTKSSTSTVYFTEEPFSYTSKQSLIKTIIDAFENTIDHSDAIITALEALWRYGKEETKEFLFENSALRQYIKKESDEKPSESQPREQENHNLLEEQDGSEGSGLDIDSFTDLETPEFREKTREYEKNQEKKEFFETHPKLSLFLKKRKPDKQIEILTQWINKRPWDLGFALLQSPQKRSIFGKPRTTLHTLIESGNIQIILYALTPFTQFNHVGDDENEFIPSNRFAGLHNDLLKVTFQKGETFLDALIKKYQKNPKQYLPAIKKMVLIAQISNRQLVNVTLAKKMHEKLSLVKDTIDVILLKQSVVKPESPSHQNDLESQLLENEEDSTSETHVTEARTGSEKQSVEENMRTVKKPIDKEEMDTEQHKKALEEMLSTLSKTMKYSGPFLDDSDEESKSDYWP